MSDPDAVKSVLIVPIIGSCWLPRALIAPDVEDAVTDSPSRKAAARFITDMPPVGSISAYSADTSLPV